MRVFKSFVDFDKEEAWLNRMAAEGHLLVKAGLTYSFAPVAPGCAVVRVDHRPSMSAADFEDYRALFADAGWRHLAGSRVSGAQYFASFSGDAGADIFSESVSRAGRYRRAIGMRAGSVLPFLVLVVSLWSLGNLSLDKLLAPRDWYLTPGLWQKDGWEFAAAFLFETPFVAFRDAGPFLLVVVCAALVSQIAYQGLLYRRAVARSRAC